jgi:hypothetical protein
MDNNSTPFEMIATGEVDVYLAPVGTPMPEPSEVPQAPWTRLGKSGGENYDPAGVTIALTQATSELRALKDVETRKIVRTSATKKMSGNVFDLTAEAMAYALNGNAIETTEPGAERGYKTIGLSLGSQVTEYALLLRTVSPYLADGASQWCFPIVVQTGSPSVVYSNNGAAGLAFEWTALVDTTQTAAKRSGWYQAEHEDAAS